MPKFAKTEDLPAEYECKVCGQSKPLSQMCLVRSDGAYKLRPRCKDCHNKRERGYRRDYKTRYLQRWRKSNRQLNESYWKGDPVRRETARIRAANLSQADKDAIAIQRRLRTRGESIPIAEARELLALYGRCYPTRFGLTPKGLREHERIRSRLRARSVKLRMPSSFQIRVMVYELSEEEPGLVIPPDKQPVPYQAAANNLRQMWKRRRHSAAIGATA